MATIINLELPENQTPIPVTRRLRDDLPAHVKGDIQWINNNTRSQRHSPQTGYYLASDRSPSHNPEPVELINNEWYGLTYVTRDVTLQRALLSDLDKGNLVNGKDASAPRCLA